MAQYAEEIEAKHKSLSDVASITRRVRLRSVLVHMAALAVVLVNAYVISFFFVYSKVVATWRLSWGGAPPPPMGPSETTVLEPPYEMTKVNQERLFAFYYPVIQLLKCRNLAWTLPNSSIVGEGDADAQATE